ncbi:putative mucin/carbohydrate-binding domain-containing protein [Paenibacillus larvae]|uniref:Type-F conjugative transfer system pilin assembly protein TraF n=1 Tax=Paenibacillus larvae subsp. larvae TaxID=147375 RepID=A0A6C0QXJ1_9BACL|nr:putative mucin/carbohydrate-binding domain-containing protein [Paenibacillus larvae]QHZ52998.1 type-F conjugative transfer system pilin assembly protein TraF [Paenibacillus larvae subsp. larvae]
MKQNLQRKNIHHLEAPTWIFNAGISKGKYHDRQDLGVLLQPQATIRIRQVNPHFNDKLIVRLLNDDQNTEKKETITSEWSTIQADAISVPFIDTPYGDQNAEVEYNIEGKQIPLPIYQPCGNEMEFFQQWDNEQAGFALVQGPSFQLLVPKKDKEFLRNLKDFKSIDELIQYYEEIFHLYNDMIGLEDTDTGTNRMSKNRYFLKADVNGCGGACYYDWCTVNSEDTVDMWLKKNNWGPLHEIGHGYQAAFDDKGMYTGEVSNNLFGVQHQYSKNGKDADKIGWLFNYGKKESVEKNLYQAIIKEGKGYEEVNDLRFKLILLTMLKQKAGNEAFTHLYREYRKLANQEGFDANKYPLPDLMNRYYGETSGYDFTPVLQKWKLYTDRIQAEINRSKGYKATASLADIVSESQLSNARKLVDKDILINSNFEMVDNQQIAPLGLKGSVKIQLNIDDINQLKGQDLLLKEGSKVVKRIAITGKELTVQDVPNGVYTIEIPTGREARYSVDKHYLYIKEKENHLTLKIERIQHSDLVNSAIQFLGIGDKQFAELRTNLNQQQAVFHVTDKDPHYRFENEKYAGIQVFDENKKVIFDKEIEGTNVPTGQEIIPLKEGYTIKIFHAETENRLISDDSNLINPKSNENTLIMTRYGLKNVGSFIQFLGYNDKQFAEFKTDLNQQQAVFHVIDKDPHYRFENEKYAGIQVLDENKKIIFDKEIQGTDVPTGQESIPLKEGYTIKIYHAETKNRLKNDSDLINPKSNENMLIVTKYGLINPSTSFINQSIQFLGYNDEQFAELKTHLNEQKAVFQVTSKDPHWKFENEKYAGIQVFDENKKVIFDKEIEGKNVPTGQESIPLKEGYTIKIFHAETENRLKSDDSIYINPKNNENTFIVTKYGLINTLFINQSIRFLGYNDEQFAELKTHLDQQKAVFYVTDKNPHWKFENEKYAAIQVFDENKKVIFDKEIEGKNVPTGQESIPLKEGYTIKIFHAETENRLKSDDSNLINPQSNENTFKVTKYGLENISLKNNAEDVLMKKIAEKDLMKKFAEKGLVGKVTEKDLMKKIDQAAERILANKEILESAVSEMKDQLWVAIQSLSNNNREIYLKKYQSIFK